MCSKIEMDSVSRQARFLRSVRYHAYAFSILKIEELIASLELSSI